MIGFLAWMSVLAFALIVGLLLTSRNGRLILVSAGAAFCIGSIVMLTACAPTKRDPIIDTRPPVTVTVTRYVPIPAELTAPQPIPSGTVDQAIEVAAARKVELLNCNGKLSKIGAVQGSTPC